MRMTEALQELRNQMRTDLDRKLNDPDLALVAHE